MSRRHITHIVIHCAATGNGDSLMRGAQTPIQVIDGWHKARGFQRREPFLSLQNWNLHHIGYHFVIGTDGNVSTGRHVDEVGAHVARHNAHSIGICMVGTDKFTRAQWRSLRLLTQRLDREHPGTTICGHRDLSPDLNGDGVIQSREWTKTCPGFDVAAWLANGMAPAPQHVYEVTPQ